MRVHSELDSRKLEKTSDSGGVRTHALSDYGLNVAP